MGRIAIYVYRQKAPVREFADDYVRTKISELSYDDAMEQCREIAALGRALAGLETSVTVPTIDVLGIEGGEYDVQRLVYHFFMKCFWNDDLDDEANAAIDFDWYHPQLCAAHAARVSRMAQAGNLEITREHVDHYGITIWGARTR